MGFFNKTKLAWGKMSAEDKLNFILDIICGIGASAVSSTVLKKLAPNMSKLQVICASFAMCGLGMAAGETATNAWKPYTESIGKVIDGISKKENEEDGE